MRRRDEAQEQPVLAADEVFPLREFEIAPPRRIVFEPRAIGLVGRETRDGIDGIGGGGGALMRREIAEQLGAATRDRLAPVARILLERGGLAGIDLVADEAGDHGLRPILSDARASIADRSSKMIRPRPKRPAHRRRGSARYCTVDFGVGMIRVITLLARSRHSGTGGAIFCFQYSGS